MESGASFHVTPHQKWFTRYNAKSTNCVWIGNDFSCDIKGIGDIKLKFQNGATFVFKDICHDPELTKSLILTEQLDDEGYTCIYGDNLWKISKGSLLVAKGTKLGSLDMLHVSSVKDNVILVAKQPSLSL